MKIERMDYVDAKRFTVGELLILEGLIKEEGFSVVEEVSEYHVLNYDHYGVDEHRNTFFNDLYFINNGGRDITEKFCEYLNSLESAEEQPVEEYETQETPAEYLTVKERLLALADGKELEWWHKDYYEGNHGKWLILESFLSDFGDILYGDKFKVRVKEEKDDLTLSFEKYCASLELPSDFTSNLFKFFKAGYDAAKDND